MVGFYDGNPDAGGVLLTNVTLPGWLAAATSAVASTVWVVTEPATNHMLYAAANRAGWRVSSTGPTTSQREHRRDGFVGVAGRATARRRTGQCG